MIPIKPNMNIPEGWRYVVFAEHQKEYIPLPAILENAYKGHAITCWKLSRKERIKLFFSGNIWLTFMTFHKPLQPILIDIVEPELTLENG